MTAERFIDAVMVALDRASQYPPESESRPVAILWPDEGRQWEQVISALRELRPVLRVGTYDQATQTGPAYWVRCFVDSALAVGPVPIVYLPGFGRSGIRAVEDAPPELKPVAELQYRGTLFAQQSGRDWTLSAFLQASGSRGGIGVDVAGDDATKAALLRASGELASVPVEELRQHSPLKATYFDGLLTPDIDRDVLRWLDDPTRFRADRSEPEWEAFRMQFSTRFGLELTRGEIEVARRLGQHETDPWGQVWKAYADAPRRYPNLEDRLRIAKPKKLSERPGLFDTRGAWPQDNDDAERELRDAFRTVAGLDSATARDRLIELDQTHAERRDWVWAQLGKAVLAEAAESLASLARATRRQVGTGDIPQQASDYVEWGWRVDDALIKSLSSVEGEDARVVGEAGSAVYRPWLENAAERMQAAVKAEPRDYKVAPLDDWQSGTCILFTDGLRFDVGKRLQKVLVENGIAADLSHRLTALPSITPTAKPAASPASSRLQGGLAFAPVSKSGGPDIGAAGLRKELEAIGYQVLSASETGDPLGLAWTEGGDIDALGHEHQARLPALLDSEVQKLAARVRALLEAGWQRVVVVTDHGWLYLPGGLPHAELSLQLTEGGKLRKHRAARLAPGSTVDVPTVAWFWDPSVQIAVAPDIRSFEGSPVYDHGGISPQECVTPVLSVTRGRALGTEVSAAVSWRGLRARVTVSGAPEGSVVDLRREAGDATSSLLARCAESDDQGMATFLVRDSDAEGMSAFVVVESDGHLLAQVSTTIGEED